MRKSRNHSFEKKLAAAVSVVNLLNAAAPIALPYVTVTRDIIGAAGATTESLSDAAARALYGTAEANTTTVHSGETSTIHILSSGDTQIVESGGTARIFPTQYPYFTDGINYGTQIVQNGGMAYITLNSGAQIIESGGSANSDMNYGTQTLQPGAYGAAGHIYANASQTIASGAKGRCDRLGGAQIISSGGMGRSTDKIFPGGTQSVLSGGTGYANVIAGGRQVISAGGLGSAAEVIGEENTGGTIVAFGSQTIYGGTGIADYMPFGGKQGVSGGLGIVNLVSGGNQEVMSGGTGVIATMDSGSQTIYSMGGMTASGTVETLKGGTQRVWDDCAGLVKVMSGGVQDIENGGTGMVSTMLGGKQLISASAKGTVKTLSSGGTQVIKNGGTGSVGTMAGGVIDLSSGGGKVSGLLIGYGTISGELNQSDAELAASGGELTTDALNVKNITIADGSRMVVSGNLTADRVSIAADVTKYKTSAPITANGDKVKIGVVDFTEATATSLQNRDYPIIWGSPSTFIDDLQVSMNSKTATLKAGGSSVLIRSEKTTAMPKPNLTVGFETKQTIELNQQSNMLFYKIRNTLTDATFNGAIPWNPDAAYLNFSAADSKFAPTFSVYVADLGFSFSDSLVSELNKGQSMDLLTGLPEYASLGGANPSPMPISCSGANTDLSGSVKGTPSIKNGTVKFTVDDIRLDSVSVKAVTANTDVVPKHWTPGLSGVQVDTDDLIVAPEDAPYTETTLLRGNNSFFRDRNITGRYKYTAKASFNHEKNGVSLDGTWSRGVRAANNGMSLVFVNSELTVNSVTLGKMAWDKPRALPANLNCNFRRATIDATNLTFTNLGTDLTAGSTTYLLTGADDLAAKANITGAAHRQDFSATAGNGVSLGATLAGTVSTEKDSIKYTADSVTLNDVALAGWNGKTGEVPESWVKNSAGVAVDTDNMSIHPEELASRNTNILTGSAGFFSDASLRGNNIYRENADFSSTRNGVTLSGNWSRGVTVENGGQDLVFRAGDVFVDNIALGTIFWKDRALLRPNAGIEAINYAKVSGVDTANFSIANPADAAPGKSVTLLTANNTLKNMATEAKATYSYSPVSGVAVTGGLTGDLVAKDGNLTFTALSNEASNIAFRGVNWTGETALMARPKNITFNGATVDASKISFMNVSTLKTGDVTTLVSGFGGAPSAIVGDKYRIGTTLEGDGHASVEWNDLIFTVESDPRAAEQAHNALMGAGAGMVVLSAGNDAINNAAGGLSQASNTGSDGVAVYAQMGGGSTRQETGSHIDVHSWNAILALGHKNEKEKSAFEYGAFFEYGTGNYTTHNGDLRGDGSMRYTGGGLLAKWTAKHGLYVEGSLRGGSIHGETNGVLRDVNDNPFSYESDAPYWGAHIGVGRELDLGHNNTLDIYGKYFMNRRNGVGFTAGEGRYDLDALTSSIIRVGARYTMKRNNWDFYGGLAYEHELDGKAGGTVSNGVLSAPIRGTDPTGGSVRMELGATMKPENSPWSLDLNLAGFAGKKRGVTGGVSVSFMF